MITEARLCKFKTTYPISSCICRTCTASSIVTSLNTKYVPCFFTCSCQAHYLHVHHMFWPVISPYVHCFVLIQKLFYCNYATLWCVVTTFILCFYRDYRVIEMTVTSRWSLNQVFSVFRVLTWGTSTSTVSVCTVRVVIITGTQLRTR